MAVLKASGKRSQAQGYAPSLHRQESRVKITDNFQDHVVLLKERVAIDDLSHQLSFLSLRGQLLLLLNGLNRFASDLPHDLCLGHRPPQAARNGRTAGVLTEYCCVILSDKRSQEPKDPYTRNNFSQLVVTSGFALGAPGSRPYFGTLT